jgi:hypothetical protein
MELECQEKFSKIQNTVVNTRLFKTKEVFYIFAHVRMFQIALIISRNCFPKCVYVFNSHGACFLGGRIYDIQGGSCFDEI